MTVSTSNLAVVTGAGGGMGAASAHALAAAGYALVLCDIDAARIARIVAELGTAQVVGQIAGDITSPAFIADLLAAIGDREVSALVHTAGLSPTMAGPERVIRVNFDASVAIVNALSPRMANGGCAVLISSSSAYMMPTAPFAGPIAEAIAAGSGDALVAISDTPEKAYPISKQAVIALVRSQAAVFARRGARIVSIAPGLIDTPMSSSEFAKSEVMASMLAKTPLGRLGRADEIASMAVMLASPAASYVTGCDILVDGGTIAAVMG